tara:strand:- start:85 stop:675 length:591 start_codon:yes stop_codon:yes gene_type:complete
MKKNSFKIYLLIFSIVFISCKEEQVEELLVVDYKVVELNYNFQNYWNNVRNKSETFVIKERNFLEIEVNEKGECKIEGEIVSDSLIVSELKKYITPNPENNKMPLAIEKEFYYSGKIFVNKLLMTHAIYHENLNYKNYSKIRNKIFIAYSEVRNDFALKKFKKNLKELRNSNQENDFSKYEEINEIYPMLYTEGID